MSEVWKDSITLSGRYMVSSTGRVKRTAHFTINKAGIKKLFSERLIQRKKANDYPRINLKFDGKAKAFLIHRLVAEVFVPNPHGYPCINHKDGDKSNPHPSNLEWCTHHQNMLHAKETGLLKCEVPVQSQKNGMGYWYPSLESAKNHSGVSKPCICAAAKKRQATAGRMVWDYTNKVVEYFTGQGVVFDDLLSEG